MRWLDDGAVLALLGVGALALGGAAVRRMGSRAFTEAERDALPSSAFAVPGERAFPMVSPDGLPSLEYGKRALTYAMWPNNEPHRAEVMRNVFARYPSLVGWWNQTKWVRDHPKWAYLAEPKVARVDLNEILAGVA
jgi:hypothetical protein